MEKEVWELHHLKRELADAERILKIVAHDIECHMPPLNPFDLTFRRKHDQGMAVTHVRIRVHLLELLLEQLMKRNASELSKIDDNLVLDCIDGMGKGRSAYYVQQLLIDLAKPSLLMEDALELFRAHGSANHDKTQDA